MALTTKQIEELNKVINRLSLDRLKGYASDGTITREVLDQLTNISPERYAQLLAVIDSAPPVAKPLEPEPAPVNTPEQPTPETNPEPPKPVPSSHMPSRSLDQELTKMHEEGYTYSAEQVFQLLDQGPVTRQHLFD